MLPSTGYFKALACPFLRGPGCERPHCHYKHARPRPTYRPTPLAQLARPRHLPVPYSPQPPRARAPLRYRPTPLPPGLTVDEEERKPKSDAPVDNFIGLEDLTSEFEILDQILVEEKGVIDPEPKIPAAVVDDVVPEQKSNDGKSKCDEDKIESAEDGTSKSLSDSSKKHPEKRKRSVDAADDKSSKRKSEESAKRSKDRDSKKSSSSRDDRNKISSSSNKGDKRRDESRSESKKSESKSRSSNKTSSSKTSKETPRNSDKKSDRRKEDESRKRRHSSDKSKREREKRSRTSDKEKSNKSEKESSVELNFRIEDDVMDIFSSDSDEEAINRECLKIFEEYKAPEVEVRPVVENVDRRDADDDESSFVNKKRVAHSAEQNVYRTAPRVALPNHKAKAVQLMAERYKIRKSETITTTPVSSAEPDVGVNNVKREPPLGAVFSAASKNSKVRIAHVPNVSTLLSAKKTIPKPVEAPKLTIAQTVSKGVSRTAHMPSDKFCDRPGVLEPLTSKISLNVRSRFLNLIIDECLKIYLAPEDAYARALQEELTTSKRCTSTHIYKNSATLTISRLRKESQDTNRAEVKDGTVSHNKILDGKQAEKVSWSIERKYRKDDQFTDEFKGLKFYNNVARWVMSEKELMDNGFPRPYPTGTEKGRAKIYTKNTKQKPPRGYVRTCCRCKKEYTVDKKGVAVVKEECFYHPKNKFRLRQEVSYQCCRQDETSEGCLAATCHVYEYLDHDNLRGYVKTLPKDASADANTKVYALDCEMCYTTNGLDLTRVTVIDSSCKVIYESLVKPIFPIIDYNTRFSGLTEETMKDCKTSLLEVQATFLHMFSEKTILVGHSLESDFKALKLIHDTVVDTSVLFPHKMGPPYKRALRNLSSEHLKKIIQNSVEGGHDSAEDAMVCMELLIWKLKEELKLR